MNATFRLFKVFKHNKKRVLLSMCLFVGLACFSPSTAYGAGSILQNIWCNTSSFFGFPCEGAWEPMEVIPPKKVPPQKAVSVPSYIQQTLSTLPESVTSRITNVYNTHPVTVVYKSVTAEDDTLTPDVSNEKEDEGYVSLSLFRKQIDSLEDDIGDRVGDATDDLQESFTTETLTVSGTLADSNGSTGLNNYILMSTGSGVVWTSTSSLGFGSNIDFDTSSELADILTDETGTGNVVFSNSPTFSGTITTALIDGCVEVASGVLTSTGANCGVGGGGVTSFNGQVNSSQSFASSTTGTDFRITSSGGVHTFSLPSASASARGLLTSAYFTSFNNRVSSSSIDTSAELIALVTDETGTGSLVFSASPTFTGTALASALTLSSTLTLSGTSANIALGSNWLSGDGDDEGVYVSSTGNVGVGTSSPLARFTVAGGNILMDNTRSITFMDGAGTAREVINVSAGDDITIGATTLDDIRLDVGGVSNALRILQTTGNVGIGTTSPLSRLHIFENTTQVGTLAGLTVEQDGTGDAILQFLLPSRRWVIGADNSDSDKFKISSTVDLNTDAHFVIDISGNIGIGTTTPSAKLHLTGTAGSSDIFAISSSTNSRLFTVAANGRVGIGTSNPVYSLDISGNGRFTSTLSASRFLPNSATSASGNSIYLANTNDIAISNNGVETIRFASDGNVGIGTSTPLARLTVRTTGTTDILNLFETDGSEVFTVLESGNVGIGDTSPAALFTVGSGDLFQVNSSGAIAAATGVTSSGIISVDAGGTQDGHQIGRLGIDYASNGNPTIYSTGGTSIEVAAHLSINGDIYSSVSQASNFILGHNRTGFGIVFRTATSTNSVLSDALTIQSSGNVIVNQGNVGIGTTSPSARLAIVSSGSTAATRAFQIVNSASTNLFRIDDTGDILLTDSGVDQFTFGVSTAQFGRVSGQALGVSISGIAKVLFGGTGGEYRTMSGGIYGWSSHASNVASAVADTALSRTSAGVVAVGNGTSGNTSGTLLASSIGIGTTTPSQELTVTGDLRLTGRIYDTLNSPGTNGMVLLSTGTGQTWVATSTLGFALTNDFNTSAELLALITDETGTGNLVFSSSPTFTGTVLASAATLSSTLTMSGASANIALGSNYLSGDGDDEGVYVSSTGNVGIGSTTPNEKLHVFGGNVAIDRGYSYGARYGGAFYPFVGLNSASQIVFGPLTSNTNTRIKIGNGAEDIELQANAKNIIFQNLALGTESMRITGTGNVGIGTSSPQARLTVRTTGTTDILNLFETGGSEVFTVLESGNVGIGTSSPLAMLHLQKSFSAATPSIIITDNNTTTNHEITGAGDLTFNADADSGTPLTNMIFKMDDVEYMRLQYGGNVGIGTTTPSQELTVTGDLRLTGRIYDSLNNAGTNGMVLRSTGTGQTWVATSTLGFASTNDFNTSAELLAILTDETGSGALVFGTAPTISALTTTGITTLSSQTAARALFTDASSRATTTALSATLLNSLTDETGTGVAVFSASPTFTGNTTFANASSTNLTVSGRTYLATTTVSRSFLVSGTNGGTPASGSGTRMMWVPSKGAFRAGGVSGTEWDSANIGVYSSAFGYDTIASHLGSFAMGYNSGAASSITASNLGSFAGGYAQGTGANSITASQAGSFAFGYANGSASDEGQITASGYSSFALGRAVGADARLTASGDGSFAMGYATANLTATGQASFAIGEDVNATANNAFALGQSFTNSTASTFQVGFSATPTFTVTGTRVGIASSTPSQELSVSGDISVTGRIYDSNNSPGTNGMVLLSTGTGQTWVATSTLGFASSNDFNTSAELLAILTDETGTGSAVFSASPTFTGTALASALTLSSTLTLSGTSANIALGSNYLSGDGDDEGVYVSSTGNVGIGTSTPGTFKLQVLGNIGPDADSLYSLGNTTLRFSQINTRILHGGANSLDVMSSSAIVGGGIKFSAGSGTPLRMIIDGSNGNVGIGTSSPSQKLHIEGNILVNGVSNGGLTVNTQNNINALRVVGAAVPRVVIGSGSDDAVNNLQVLGTSYFSGNVGIGTSTPLARLTVRTTGTTDILNLFETDGSEVFTVLESGNVGIGTTTPSGKLVIEDSTDGASLVTISSTVANPAVDTTLLKLSARADADAQTRYIQGYSNNNTSLMFEIYSENSTTDRTVFSTGIHSMYQSSRDISFLYNTDLASAPNAFLFNGLASNREMTSGSVNQAIVRIGGFFAQSGTASADGLVVAPTFTSLGSGSAGGTGNNIFRAANGSDTKFVINSAGLVGIGTTTPQALLTVRTTGTTDILNLFETDGSEVFTVLESGNVGIGDVDPTEAQLVIGASGAGSIYLTLMASGTTDNAVCWDNAGATLLYDCDGTPADYAESYPTENNVQFGHIVMNTEEVVTTKIGTNVPKLAKAERNEGRIIGITSDNYHDFTSAGKDEIASQDRPLPVALVGRVPVKVNLEGGEIAIGDPITISSVPGIGTKATTSGSFTIGTALESYTEEDEDNNKDTVLVFVANGTFETQADIQRQQLFAETITDDTFDLLLENQPDTIWTRLTTLAQGFVDGVLQVAGVRASEVKTDVLCVGSVCVDEETFLNLVQGSGSNSNNQDDTEEAGDEEIPETPEESASSTPPTQQEDTQPEEGGEEEVTETGNEEIPETPEEEIETP